MCNKSLKVDVHVKISIRIFHTNRNPRKGHTCIECLESEKSCKYHNLHDVI